MPDPIEASPGLKTTALTGVRVLVLDDEEDCRDIVAAVLESAGATVYPVDSVRNAFVALDGFRPDVLVSDINMPEEDGKSFVRRLRAIGDERATLPAIALTALPGRPRPGGRSRRGVHDVRDEADGPRGPGGNGASGSSDRGLPPLGLRRAISSAGD